MMEGILPKLTEAILNEILKRRGDLFPLPKPPKRHNKVILNASVNVKTNEVISNISANFKLPKSLVAGIILDMVVKYLSNEV